TLVDLGEALEASQEECDLGGGGALLGCERLSGVDEGDRHVASHGHVDTPQPAGAEGGDAPEPTIGGGRPADTDDDPPGTSVEGGGDELSGAVCLRLHGVVALGAPSESETRSPRHL